MPHSAILANINKVQQYWKKTSPPKRTKYSLTNLLSNSTKIYPYFLSILPVQLTDRKTDKNRTILITSINAKTANYKTQH